MPCHRRKPCDRRKLWHRRNPLDRRRSMGRCMPRGWRKPWGRRRPRCRLELSHQVRVRRIAGNIGRGSLEYVPCVDPQSSSNFGLIRAETGQITQILVEHGPTCGPIWPNLPGRSGGRPTVGRSRIGGPAPTEASRTSPRSEFDSTRVGRVRPAIPSGSPVREYRQRPRRDASRARAQRGPRAPASHRAAVQVRRGSPARAPSLRLIAPLG